MRCTLLLKTYSPVPPSEAFDGLFDEGCRGGVVLRAATCSSPRLSGLRRPAMLRGPGGQSVHLLETAVLLPPHVVDLHGRLALRHQIQVLLRQVSPQLPDFKLEGQRGRSEVDCL